MLNAIVVFDRDVKTSELNAFPQNFNGDVVINGTLVEDENLILDCTIYASAY